MTVDLAGEVRKTFGSSIGSSGYTPLFFAMGNVDTRVSWPIRV
jgi:hypothetical protein